MEVRTILRIYFYDLFKLKKYKLKKYKVLRTHARFVTNNFHAKKADFLTLHSNILMRENY